MALALVLLYSSIFLVHSGALNEVRKTMMASPRNISQSLKTKVAWLRMLMRSEGYDRTSAAMSRGFWKKVRVFDTVRPEVLTAQFRKIGLPWYSKYIAFIILRPKSVRDRQNLWEGTKSNSQPIIRSSRFLILNAYKKCVWVNTKGKNGPRLLEIYRRTLFPTNFKRSNKAVLDLAHAVHLIP